MFEGLTCPCNKPLAMEVTERLERSLEGRPHLLGLQRARLEYLRKTLLRKLHHNVEHRHMVDFRSPRRIHTKQIRMRQFRCLSPAHKLPFVIFSERRDQLDRGSHGDAAIVKFGQEDRAVFRAPDVQPERKRTVDALARPLFPGFGHKFPHVQN